jgi:hypothetical protein
MRRFWIIIICFAVLLGVGNMLQVKKIQDQEAQNPMSVIEKGIEGAFPYLRYKQRIFYIGVKDIDYYDFYQLTVQIMAPKYLLEYSIKPQKSDTLLLICEHDKYPQYFQSDSIETIWMHTDDRFTYLLGKRK